MAFDKKWQFLHATSLNLKQDGYYLSICEKNVDTGAKRIRNIRNPVRPFWVTKPARRTNKEKIEFAKESDLDMFLAPQNELASEIAKRLGEYKGPNAWYDLRKLCDSPYVYGADIDPEVIYRIKYMKSCEPIKKFAVGFLDIETSVFGDEQVIVFTYVDPDFCIHTAILSSFMRGHTLEDVEKYRTQVWWKQFIGNINDDTMKAIIKYKYPIDTIPQDLKASYDAWTSKKITYETADKPFKDFVSATLSNLFTFDVSIHEKEADLILKIAADIHKTIPDFIGIWNMDYDIPYLIDRLTKLGVPIQNAFVHPDIPRHLRIVVYKKDKGKKGQHFTDRWHWLFNPGYTKYVDSMNLYSRIRAVDGRENSYKLEFIATKEIGTGKMPTTTHEDMQENHFVEYVVYNMVDGAVLALMELLNHDVDSLYGLAYISPLQEFAHQTKLLINNFYEYCRDNKMVPAAVGGSQLKETDELITNVGGAVLEPTNIRDAGMPALIENEDLTNLYFMVCDIDVSSMYPNTLVAFNVSKQTKLSTALAIEGKEVIYSSTEKGDDGRPKILYDPVNDFFAHISFATENAVRLGKEYFNLPDYMELLNLYKDNNK